MRNSSRWLHRGLMAMLPMACLGIGMRTALSQPPDAFKYKGPADVACRTCHINPQVGDKEARMLERINKDEFSFWIGMKPESRAHQDMHSRSYAMLVPSQTWAPKLLKQMEDRLSITAASDARCLSCHAPAPRLEAIDFSKRTTAPQKIERRQKIVQEGVSCEACHGPASSWLEPHNKLDDWRPLSSREKETLHGLYNVWDAEKRADLCLSCHLGDSRQGRIVTHEMFAAGHPLLPAVEAETLVLSMPRHRKPLKDKSPDGQKQYDYQPHQMPQARQVVIAGLVTMREAIELMLDEATQSRGWNEKHLEAAQYRATGWPELSLYDCAACHHDLQTESWRQRRGFASAPGRPAMRAWPTALARLGLVAVDRDANELNTILSPLQAQLGRKPYGDRQAVAAAARKAVNQLDTVVKQLNKQTYDRKMSVKLLRAICQLGQAETPDFDSARQWGRAFKVIYDEARAPNPSPAAIETHKKFARILDREFNSELQLTGDSRSDAASAKLLEAAAEFQPEKFQQQLNALEQLLPKPFAKPPPDGSATRILH